MASSRSVREGMSSLEMSFQVDCTASTWGSGSTGSGVGVEVGFCVGLGVAAGAEGLALGAAEGAWVLPPQGVGLYRQATTCRENALTSASSPAYVVMFARCANQADKIGLPPQVSDYTGKPRPEK